MYESKEHYLEIVSREVQKLEETCQYKIANGELGYCPRCGRQGIWDIDTKGFIHTMENSVYYSTVFNQWRCGICDNRKLAEGEQQPLICRKTGRDEAIEWK